MFRIKQNRRHENLIVFRTAGRVGLGYAEHFFNTQILGVAFENLLGLLYRKRTYHIVDGVV